MPAPRWPHRHRQARKSVRGRPSRWRKAACWVRPRAACCSRCAASSGRRGSGPHLDGRVGRGHRPGLRTSAVPRPAAGHASTAGGAVGPARAGAGQVLFKQGDTEASLFIVVGRRVRGLPRGRWKRGRRRPDHCRRLYRRDRHADRRPARGHGHRHDPVHRVRAAPGPGGPVAGRAAGTGRTPSSSRCAAARPCSTAASPPASLRRPCPGGALLDRIRGFFHLRG